MLTLRTVRLAALALVAALPLAGCFDTFAEPYDGPTVVEFEQRSGQYGLTAIEGDGLYELTVNLIDPQGTRSTPTTIQVGVVDTLTTGAEGTLYEFPEGTDVTIPAGQTSAVLPIRILNNSVESNKQATIGLNLEGTADGSVTGADLLDDFLIKVLSKRLRFVNSSGTVAESATTVNAQVRIIGTPEDVPLNVNLEVVSSQTTAVQGTHYTLPAGTQIAVPPGTQTVNFPIQILDNSLAAGATVRLVLRIVGTDDNRILGDTALRTFTLTIRGA